MHKKGLKSCNIKKMIQKLDKMLENWPKNQELINKEIQELEYTPQSHNQQRNEEEKHS